jgi:hypothetical protein
VTDRSRVAVIPVYRDTAPRRPSDRTLVCGITFPTDAIAELKLSRFIASHVVVAVACGKQNGPRVEIWGRSERRPTTRLGAEEIGHPLLIRSKIRVLIRPPRNRPTKRNGPSAGNTKAV